MRQDNSNFKVSRKFLKKEKNKGGTVFSKRSHKTGLDVDKENDMEW